MSGTSTASTPGFTRLETIVIAIGALLSIIVVSLELAHANEIVVFALSAVTLVALAWLLGEATGELGERLGGRVAGFLNATLGNLPELVVVVLLIRAARDNPELIDVAKASLVGSVLGNVLFVLGLAFLVGGLKFGTQTFRRGFASLNATMLVLAVGALAVPELIKFQRAEAAEHIQGISVALAVVLFIVYIASTVYVLRGGDDAHTPKSPTHTDPRWSMRTSVAVLVASAVGVGVVSEALVGSMEHTIAELGISASFMGFILVPVVGNIAEHLVAVQLAARDDMDFALTIALGSSIQVALLLVPAALFLSYLVGNPIDLVFEPRQLLAISLAAIIVPLLVGDGESTWIEGLQLLALYALIAIGFWY